MDGKVTIASVCAVLVASAAHAQNELDQIDTTEDEKELFFLAAFHRRWIIY
jgi:hypothetical protein